MDDVSERVAEALSKADQFWKQATSGSRGYIHQHPFLNLFCFHETVLPGVFRRIDLYLYILFYLIVLLIRTQLQHPDQTVILRESEFSHSLLTALTSGMTFYLGFYNSSIWTRFDDQWKNTMVAASRIADLNILLGTYVEDQKVRTDVMRFVNVYHHLVYLDQGGVSVSDALKLVVLRRLLTNTEAERLGKMTCDIGERLLVWASSRVQNERPQGLEPVMRKHLIDLILVIRRNASFIRAYDAQPIPFVYYHFMNLLVTIVLAVTAVDSATQTAITDSSLSSEGSVRILYPALLYHTFLHTVYTMSILGMRELTIMLSDPFAHGRNAIPTSRYMDSVLVKTSMHAKENAVDAMDITQDPGFQNAHETFEALGTKDGEQHPTFNHMARKIGFYHGLKDWERRTVNKAHGFSSSFQDLMEQSVGVTPRPSRPGSVNRGSCGGADARLGQLGSDLLKRDAADGSQKASKSCGGSVSDGDSPAYGSGSCCRAPYGSSRFPSVSSLEGHGPEETSLPSHREGSAEEEHEGDTDIEHEPSEVGWERGSLFEISQREIDMQKPLISHSQRSGIKYTP